MRGSPVIVFASLFLFSLSLPACDPGDEAGLDSVDEAVSTSEGFETGSKGAYAAGDVAFASGTWTLDDALVGTIAGDVKDGQQAVRLRNSGTLTMDFDRAGAGTVSVKYASYGADAGGTFAIFASSDGGASWSQLGGSFTSSSGSFASASVAVNRTGSVRFQFRKTDGGSNRIDLDDVVVTDAATPDPIPDPTPTPGGSGAAISVHTKLGLPAAASTSDRSAYLSVKAQYVVSYNGTRKVPNWVSWELNSAYLGSAARQNNYRSDSTLPSSLPQATPADYSGSGWDRGHMCPSADRTASTTANGQTFYLTNMVPQATNNNGGPWAKLEDYERGLATSGKEVMIVAGGTYSSSSRTIGAGVSVPDSTWKVVVVLDKTSDGAAQVKTTTRVIGVIMPNDDARISASDTWQKYRVSVRTIENATHFDFLSDVPRSVQDVVETRVDNL
jgi:endonuclease G